MPFEVEIEGLEECRNAFGSAVNIIRNAVGRGVQMGVREGAAEARSSHLFKNRTGDLERSIVGDALGWRGGDYYEGVLRATMPYASYVENGTSPHVIEASGRALAFDWKGTFVFFKRVHHPGSKPYPFMSIAYLKAERVIVREIEIGIAAAQQVLR